MKLLEEDFEHLSELIRQVYDILSPNDEDDLSWLYQKHIRDKLYGDRPDCFIPLKSPDGNSTLPFFCICNRSGIHDARIIKVSLGVVQKMIEKGVYDNTELNKIRIRLQSLHTRYDKQVPSSYPSSTIKGMETKKFNRIKQYVDNLRK